MGLGASYAALLGRKIRRGVAVRQMRTESRHKEKLPHDKDQRNGADAQQIFQCRVMADHQMPGNGVEQHFQTAAGAVLGQHLDKLDADDDVQAALQKGADFRVVAVHQQPRHPPDQRYGAENQPHQHQAGQQYLQ